MKYAVNINDLEKRYPAFELKIDELNIPSGTIIGLIGENGAGKTTLIKAILGIIRKDKGQIRVFGKDHEKEELNVKEDIGVVLDNAFFPELLTPKDIDLIMKDVYRNWDSEMFYNYLRDFSIDERQQLKVMSKGMRKKVEIATALSHHPKLLILDEATSGLDPIVRNEVLDLFMDFISDDEHTIVMSTHITSDLEHIADYIVFINKGRIVLNETRDDIIDRYGILKCDIDSFDRIDSSDIVSFIKNRYDYEILVKDREACREKYRDFVIDNISIEELMLLMVKGGK
ncbi:MAG: ABC transporter ATP-binding protein [Erysipelotrichaceae bacterium]|nr:ABC transporter ATP-binding protein [Erysipelotrichaceae bacterium]